MTVCINFNMLNLILQTKVYSNPHFSLRLMTLPYFLFMLCIVLFWVSIDIFCSKVMWSSIIYFWIQIPAGILFFVIFSIKRSSWDYHTLSVILVLELINLIIINLILSFHCQRDFLLILNKLFLLLISILSFIS